MMSIPVAFIKFYVMRIRRGAMTIEEVPAKYRDAVQEALDNGEYMPNEVGI